MSVTRVQHRRELPGVHGRRAEIANLPDPNEVVQRLERFLDRGLRIESMDLIEVDVVRLKPREGRIDRIEHVLAGQTPVVDALPHREV